MAVLIFILGLIFGSFISAISYRLPRKKDFVKDRSRCPKCGRTIKWFDNIPLFSYLILRGKCRNCGKPISVRYPLIEFFTASVFLLLYYTYSGCHFSFFSLNLSGSPYCLWSDHLSMLSLPYFYLITILLITIFIIDLEHKLILDPLVFIGIITTSILLIFFYPDELYLYIFSGFAAAVFLLLLNLITLGKGMGLGDVKFAILLGMIAGGKFTVIWLMLSFIIGAAIGLFLIAIKKAHIGRQIPFGPFMVISFYLTFIFGNMLADRFLPFW